MPKRFGFVAVALAAGLVAGRTVTAVGPTTLPTTAPTAADAIFGTPDTQAVVDHLVDRLSADDPAVRDKAAEDVEYLSYADLPMLAAAQARDDLPPEASARLHRLLPVMQTRAKLQQRRYDRVMVSIAYQTAQALADYDRDGHANPKWDADARAFLTTAVHDGLVWSSLVPADRAAAARRHLKSALDAGCDDPDVLAYGARFTASLPPKGTSAAKAKAAGLAMYHRADKAAADGKVGPMCRVLIDEELLAADANRPDVAALVEVRRVLADLLAQYHRLLAEPAAPATVVVDLAHDLMDQAEDTHVAADAVLTDVAQPLEAKLPNDPVALLVKGRAYVRWAWAARGAGVAGTVTPQGWQDFRDRLDVANQALTRSWELDPGDPRPATAMLNVELGQGKGRAVMELWFKRAMDADPDHEAACRRKLLYLEPKWYGSADDMLAFAHQCRDGENWRSQIPWLQVTAHTTVANYSPSRAAYDAYYLRPGVWEDIRSVYEGYLHHGGGITYGAHSHYAAFAVLCHQWKVANAEFKLLGKHANPADFGGQAKLDADRATAARLADQPDEQGK